MSQLLDMLGCRYPIIQGPIARTNSPQMIAAMAGAGQVSALIREIKPVKAIIEEMVSRGM